MLCLVLGINLCSWTFNGVRFNVGNLRTWRRSESELEANQDGPGSRRHSGAFSEPPGTFRRLSESQELPGPAPLLLRHSSEPGGPP